MNPSRVLWERGAHDARVHIRGQSHGRVQGTGNAAERENVSAGLFLGFPAGGSLRGPESNGCPSQTTAGEPGGHGVTGSETLVASPYAVGLGSVSVLERVTGWKCWIPSHRRAICGAE